MEQMMDVDLSESDLVGHLTFDPVLDVLEVRFSEAEPVRSVALDDGIVLSIDADANAVELVAFAATMGRQQSWREALKAMVGAECINALDVFDQTFAPARDLKIYVSPEEAREVRSHWQLVSAVAEAHDSGVALTWQECEEAAAQMALDSEPADGADRDRAMSRILALAANVAEKFAEKLKTTVDAISLQIVPNPAIAFRGPGEPAVVAPRNLRLDDEIVAGTGLAPWIAIEFDGGLLRLAANADAGEVGGLTVALVVGDENVSDPVAFELSEDDGVATAQLDLSGARVGDGELTLLLAFSNTVNPSTSAQRRDRMERLVAALEEGTVFQSDRGEQGSPSSGGGDSW